MTTARPGLMPRAVMSATAARVFSSMRCAMALPSIKVMPSRVAGREVEAARSNVVIRTARTVGRDGDIAATGEVARRFQQRRRAAPRTGAAHISHAKALRHGSQPAAILARAGEDAHRHRTPAGRPV